VQLLDRMPALLERRPADALQLTALAVGIAESLNPRCSWEEGAILARGQALREHAYVLSFLGRDREALQYVERAAREFAQVPADGFELARLALVKASALRLQGRTEEAIALARQAAETFREIDEPVRAVDARITEAAILYDAGAVERALEVWSALRGDPSLTELSALRIAHNIAVCLCDLGRHPEAVEPLEQCVAGFAAAGMLTERTRSRWYLAKALLGTGRRGEGEALLRTAWSEFTALDLPVEAALAAFDLAEAFVVDEDVAEVPAICQDAIAQLAGAGVGVQAVPALAVLGEAAGRGGVSRELLREAHGKVATVRPRSLV
jgi:tetratricopeptide (TPR) repeat protein